MATNYLEYLETCERAARAGGAALLQWIGNFEVREKGPRDLVTQADLASQEAIREIILRQFPDHAFISEEDTRSFAVQAPYRWIVDPLDGTTNYVHQVPHYCVSVAMEQNGDVVVGCVWDPVNEECFTASRGSGAFLNGRPIHTSDVAVISESLVAASFSAKVSLSSPEIAQFIGTLLRCQGVRRTGSAALNLCHVAAGRFDAFWALSTQSWDVAAGVLIVEEAGGVVTDLQGERLRLSHPHPVASANQALHRQFRQLLANAPLRVTIDAQLNES